jgi:hypothetical protein
MVTEAPAELRRITTITLELLETAEPEPGSRLYCVARAAPM